MRRCAARPRAPTPTLAPRCGWGLCSLAAAQLWRGVPFLIGKAVWFAGEVGAKHTQAVSCRLVAPILPDARTAFLLRLHPDRLRQAGEREQLQGLLATQVFNSLWATERGHT